LVLTFRDHGGEAGARSPHGLATVAQGLAPEGFPVDASQASATKAVGIFRFVLAASDDVALQEMPDRESNPSTLISVA
jgi:hypothetical protein